VFRTHSTGTAATSTAGVAKAARDLVNAVGPLLRLGVIFGLIRRSQAGTPGTGGLSVAGNVEVVATRAQTQVEEVEGVVDRGAVGQLVWRAEALEQARKRRRLLAGRLLGEREDLQRREASEVEAVVSLHLNDECWVTALRVTLGARTPTRETIHHEEVAVRPPEGEAAELDRLAFR